MFSGNAYVTVTLVELLEYVNAAGVSPFAKWREKLDATAKGAGIFELRLDFGPGYRVYFGKDGERWVVLLGGGTKKRQQADIKAAQALWQEYKRTKGKRGNDGKHTKL